MRQVITEGQAVILRDEEDVSEPIVLAEVGEGAYFGERALLKNTVRFAPAKAASPSVALYHLLCPSIAFSLPFSQVRFASVKAVSKKLYTMCGRRARTHRPYRSQGTRRCPVHH